MEITGKAHHSATMPLLIHISDNPSKPYVSPSMTSWCIAKLGPVHLILSLTLTLGFLVLLCTFMSMSMSTFMSLLPQTPKVQLNSLFVSKFNISNTTLEANFDATITVKNPNLVSWVGFDCVKGLILYKEHELAMMSAEPFVLGMKEQKMVHMKVSTAGRLEERRPVVKEWVLDEMSRQREDGIANFSMQMFVSATYRTGSWATQHVIMNPQCLGLRVGFLPKFGFGSWITRGSMVCSVPPSVD